MTGKGEHGNRLIRFRELFEQLLDMPASVHSEFLDKNCPGDAEMRRELLSLIQQTQSAGRKMDEVMEVARDQATGTMPLGSSPPTEKPGTVIGNYTLMERIGDGGFGSVWLAEQTAPVRRRVALKIIKLGMDTAEVVARFETERQALAMMDHPNIATVFDAGATDTGRPYFAMEYVPGIPITDYCNQNHLPVRERLLLFIRVCGAIQHAHQTGVIHRDIKPSNILVSSLEGRPLPKVIDFGIAKATGRKLTDRTFVTQLHTFVGTPVYSSPEQMDTVGQFVDTRTDIYSLGIVLYELLTGHVPFDPGTIARHGFQAMNQIIREDEPQKPSTRLRNLSREDRDAVARQLGANGTDLQSQIKGDLDAIVMHCIERDRTRRYATANSLAEDLGHFLAHRPISARHPTRAYLVRKFLVRHHRMVSSIVAMFLILIAGTVTSAWQAYRATRAEQRQVEARKSAEATLLTYNARVLLENERASNTDALAHVIASLERGDTPERRLLALKALWKAPLYYRIDSVNGSKPCEGVQFSKDGKWLITGSDKPEILLWPSHGGSPTALATDDLEFVPMGMQLSPSGKLLLVHYQKKDAPIFTGPFKQVIWDMDSLTPYREWTVDNWAPNWFHPDETKLLAYSLVKESPFPGVAWWSIDDQTIVPLGSPHESPPADIRFPPVQMFPFYYSPSADMKWLVSWRDDDVFVTPLGDTSLGDPVRIGSMEDGMEGASINRDGNLVSSADERQLTVWSRQQPGKELFRLKTYGSSGAFDIWESHIISGDANYALWAYDFNGPIGSDYTPLHPFGKVSIQVSMHNSSKWLAVATAYGKGATSPDDENFPPVSIYNLNATRAYHVDTHVTGELETFNGIRLFPDLSKALIPTSDGRIYIVDLQSPELPRKLFFETPERNHILHEVFDPLDEYLLLGTFKEYAWLVPLDGGPAIHLKEAPPTTVFMAFSPSGKFIALAAGLLDLPENERHARILDRQGSLVARLEGFDDELINYLVFLNEHELLISSDKSLKLWNFHEDRTGIIKSGRNFGISASENYVLANSGNSLDLYDRATLDPIDVQLNAPVGKTESFFNFTMIAPNEKFIIGRDRKRNILIQYIGEDRHHLIPNQSPYTGDIYIDPNGCWFAAINYQGIVTYWPIPRGEPLHDRPIGEFIDILKAQTNIRVVLDPDDDRGYRYETDPFPGWEVNQSWQQWYSPDYDANRPWKPMLDLEALGIQPD